MTKGELPPPLRLLLGSQFGLFFVGNNLALVGTWMQRIACSWLVWEWTGSAFWLGVLAAGDLLPVVFVGPFAGVAADRWNRLKQNRAAQLMSAVLAAALAALLFAHSLTIGLLIALVTVQGTLMAAIQPARLAMVQQMVPREDMVTAVALNSVSINLARLIGPAIAGVMILYVEVFWIFLINAAVTLLFVLVLGLLKLSPQMKSDSRENFWVQMAQGFVYVAHEKALLLILAMLAVGGIFVRSMLEIVPAIAAQTFSNSATGLAALTSASAVGAIVSGLTIGRPPALRLFRSVMIWWIVGSAATFAITQTSSPLLAIVSAMVLGGAITRCLVGTQTFAQLTTPDALRGRALSMHGLIARGSPAIGALAVGYASDRIGLGNAAAIASLLIVVIVLGLLPLVQSISRQVRECE